MLRHYTPPPRSHAPAWECSLGRSSVQFDYVTKQAGDVDAGASESAFPRQSVGTINLSPRSHAPRGNAFEACCAANHEQPLRDKNPLLTKANTYFALACPVFQTWNLATSRTDAGSLSTALRFSGFYLAQRAANAFPRSAWEREITDRNGQLVWRCDLIRDTGRELLGC